MIEKTHLVSHVEKQIQQFYEELKHFGDAAPAQRMRIEGQCQLLLDTGLIAWQQLQNVIKPLYLQATDEESAQDFWHWCQQQNIFRLPYQTRKAPVN